MFFHFLELFKELFCEIIIWVMVRTKEGDKAGSNQAAINTWPSPLQARTDAKPLNFTGWKHQHRIDEIRLQAPAKRQLNPYKIYRGKQSWSCKSSFLNMICANCVFQIPLVKNFALIMLRKLHALATSGSLFSVDFGRIKLRFGKNIKTYLIDPMQVFPIQAAKFNGWHQFQL